MKEGDDKAPLEVALEAISQKMRKLSDQPGLGSRSLGEPSLDAQLYQMGQSWLAANATEVTASSDSICDVYLATRLYPYGGHTALIGDFVQALAAPGVESHLIVTNVLDADPTLHLTENVQSRTGITAEKTFILSGSAYEDRLQQLFKHLLTLKPQRLFLFHHPHDPLPVVVCQPQIAPQRILVHHADSVPSFGLFSPGIKIIDLNPMASAVTRFLDLKSNLLLLTSPDPGTRSAGFLTRDGLVTATSGSTAKYQRIHSYSYPETVAVILRTTGGWHYHVGHLGSKMLQEINQVLLRKNLPSSRFIHIAWTPSISGFLWEQACDLYLSSFPVDGARTNAEVLASSTPHLRYTQRPEKELVGSGSAIPGGLTWSTHENLARVLEEVRDRSQLEKLSQQMRLAYEKVHHPKVFAETLQRILEGTVIPEEAEPERDKRALRFLLKTVIHTSQASWLALNTPAKPVVNTDLKPDRRLVAAINKQRERIDFLQEQRKRLEQKLAKMESENEQRGKGRGLRARLWRWLTQP